MKSSKTQKTLRTFAVICFALVFGMLVARAVWLRFASPSQRAYRAMVLEAMPSERALLHELAPMCESGRDECMRYQCWDALSLLHEVERERVSRADALASAREMRDVRGSCPHPF